MNTLQSKCLISLMLRQAYAEKVDEEESRALWQFIKSESTR